MADSFIPSLPHSCIRASIRSAGKLCGACWGSGPVPTELLGLGALGGAATQS